MSGLSEREKVCARLLGRGYTRREIAARVRLSPKTVGKICAKPEAQALSRRVRESIDPDAYDVARELLMSPSEQIRLQAAKLLLTTPLPAEDDDPDDERPRITVVTRGPV